MKFTGSRFIQFSALIIVLCGCSNNKNHEAEIYNPAASNSNRDGISEIAVAPPPFSEDIYPCSFCHADEVTNPEPRDLIDMHDDITAMFDHDSDNRWCLDCHNEDDRDYLKLASGKLVSFEESYKLCGQCHGDKLRDWKVGVHGKRTGDWNGEKQYLLCVHCHNPHSPKFSPIVPLPPPVRQKNIY